MYVCVLEHVKNIQIKSVTEGRMEFIYFYKIFELVKCVMKQFLACQGQIVVVPHILQSKLSPVGYWHQNKMEYLLLLHQLFLVLLILLACHPCCFGWVGGGGLLLCVTSTTETHSRQGVANHALDQESHVVVVCGAGVKIYFLQEKVKSLPLWHLQAWVPIAVKSSGSLPG